MLTHRADIHQTITDRIIQAIEASPGQWQRPWLSGSPLHRPINAATGNAYRGVNTIALWVEAQLNGYNSPRWGTYRQWASLGGQVRKGSVASMVVFYKTIDQIPTEAETGEEPAKRHLIARASHVFNAEQVDGVGRGELAASDCFSPIAAAETFVASAGVTVVHGGHRAYYSPAADLIRMPPLASFVGTSTSTALEGYYSTLMHEVTHWTGSPNRCDRQLEGRFGSDAYAMEELVAELGAAFLCADLGITGEVRADHAQYLAHWLRVLKADKRAIFTAAGKAAQATEFLHQLARGPSAVEPREAASGIMATRGITTEMRP